MDVQWMGRDRGSAIQIVLHVGVRKGSRYDVRFGLGVFASIFFLVYINPLSLSMLPAYASQL